MSNLAVHTQAVPTKLVHSSPYYLVVCRKGALIRIKLKVLFMI